MLQWSQSAFEPRIWRRVNHQPILRSKAKPPARRSVRREHTTQDCVGTPDYLSSSSLRICLRFVIACYHRRSCPCRLRTFFSLVRRALSILLAALLLAGPASGVNPPARTDRRSEPPQFEALPLVRSRQNHLMVRAFINGKPAWLTVDSGAPVSAIALHRRDYFRLTPITAKSNLPARVQINGAFNNVAIARKFRIGGLTLVDEPVVVVDLGRSAAPHSYDASRKSTELSGPIFSFPPKRCWIANGSCLS